MSPGKPATTALLSLVVFGWTGTALTAQDDRGLRIEDYYRIVRPTGVAISPTGSAVAFARTRVDEEANRSRSRIWLVTPSDSTGPVPLTSSVGDASNPRWSPDGRLLSFSSDRDGESATWFLRMDRPAGEAFRIDGLRGDPLFDPTGRRLAFLEPVVPGESSPDAGPVAEAVTRALSEAEEAVLARFDGRAYDWMNYRFDRQGYLADPRDPRATPPEQIFVLPAAGGEPRQVTDLSVDVMDPVWRPDGEAFAFVADEHARDEHSYERADLWTASLDGEVSRLTDDEYHYRSPDWAPGGTRLVVRGYVGLDV
ncbi:MAG: hypothetical protein HKO53_01200, partial [Gemmatimonadetes bacterium]|nr:hypothetical protein [Gemmatimonadota bacterium]